MPDRTPAPWWHRILVSNPFLGVVIAICAWPTTSRDLTVTGGLDDSWRASLTMAVHSHRSFGSQSIFTYGPLSFLISKQLYYWWTSALALLFTLAFLAAVSAVLVGSLRKRVPLLVAVVCAYLVAGVFQVIAASSVNSTVVIEDVLALAAVFAVVAIGRRSEAPVPSWAWAGMGAFVGLTALVKITIGVGAAVLLAIATLFLTERRLRAAGGLVAGALVSFGILWTALGNSPSDLYYFGKAQVAIVAGYADAMAYEFPGRSDSYWLALFFVVVVAVFAVRHARAMATRSQVGIFLVTALTLWLLFKEAFVRHDRHDLIFFAAIPLLLCVFWTAPKAQSWLVLAALLPMLVVANLAFPLQAPSVEPLHGVSSFWHEATILTSSSQTKGVVATSRRYLRRLYALPPSMLRMMKGSTVDVRPWEQTVLWAYPSMRPAPLPVVEDYAAYTGYLDGLDQKAVLSPHAPRYILEQVGAAIDGRNPEFEPPATSLAVLCRYQPAMASGQWELLARGPDRCGTPKLLETVTLRRGRWLSVPVARRGTIVAATFHFSASPVSALSGFLYKPSPAYFVTPGHRWRFVPGTGPDLHVLQVASPQLPPAGSISTFRFAGVRGSVRVSFYAIPAR